MSVRKSLNEEESKNSSYYIVMYTHIAHTSQRERGFYLSFSFVKYTVKKKFSLWLRSNTNDIYHK